VCQHEFAHAATGLRRPSGDDIPLAARVRRLAPLHRAVSHDALTIDGDRRALTDVFPQMARSGMVETLAKKSPVDIINRFSTLLELIELRSEYAGLC
jgi:hypothetical protein